MSIEIKITCNHATDVVAEIKNLALILGVAEVNVELAPSQVTAINNDEFGESATITVKKQAVIVEPTTGTDKPLSRKEQDEAVKYMINQGEKDDRFALLTKGRQTEIENAIAKLNTVVDDPSDANVDDMFVDDASEKVVSREDVSVMMAKVGKDEDGHGIREKMLLIRAVLVENIPEGLEPKVKNIPEDKLATVYSLIEKIGD